MTLKELKKDRLRGRICFMRRFLIVLISFLPAASASFAQGNSGAITGTITDSAGALMPGVRIEARNNETGVPYQVASSTTGSYTISQLPAGKYRMSVRAGLGVSHFSGLLFSRFLL